MSKIAVIDGDIFRYLSGFAAERRYIEVTHPNGYTNKFDNQTKFAGRDKVSGELGKLNSKRDSPLLFDEFTITTIQVPEPIPVALSSARNTVNKVLSLSGATGYDFYYGTGVSFREGVSTLLQYKGNRVGSLKPTLIDEITEMFVKEFGAKEVTHYECDDKIIMECYKNPNKFVVSSDKDSRGCEVLVYNPNKPHKGIEDMRGFGKLWRDSKGKVEGQGRLFLYFQICFGDPVDNYKTSCFSDTKWGQVAAYNALKDCTNDKQAFQAMKEVFKLLYPTPKTIIGWRGDSILIDWKYVFTEMFHMARMLRWEGDEVDPIAVMDKLVGLD